MKITYLTLPLIFFCLSCSTGEPEDIAIETDPVTTLNNETHVEESNVQLTVAEDIPADQFKAKIDQGNGILIDVRTPEEFNEGSIEGARNINYLGPDFETEIENLPKNEPIFLFCKSGGRSGQAKTVLEAHGFNEVYNLIGGYSQWPY